MSGLYKSENERTFLNYYALMPLSNDEYAEDHRGLVCFGSAFLAFATLGLYPLCLGLFMAGESLLKERVHTDVGRWKHQNYQISNTASKALDFPDLGSKVEEKVKPPKIKKEVKKAAVVVSKEPEKADPNPVVIPIEKVKPKEDDLETLMKKAEREIDYWLTISRIDKPKANEIKKRILIFLYNDNQTTLNLSYYYLESLPKIFHLPQFQRLKNLDLSKNHLQSLPPEIRQLSNLEVLNLQDNRLHRLPPEIGDLHKLQNLNLSKNRLGTLPPQIQNLSNLTDLDVDSNGLAILPPEIGKLSALKHLSCYNNQLTTLPSEFGNLNSLEDVLLEANQLTELPSTIGNLQHLRSLNLRVNNITKLPEEILNLKRCKVRISYKKAKDFPEEESKLQETVLKLQDAANVEGYKGPTINGPY